LTNSFDSKSCVESIFRGGPEDLDLNGAMTNDVARTFIWKYK